MSKSYVVITLGNGSFRGEGVVRRRCNGDCANCAKSRAAANEDASPQSPSREPAPAPTRLSDSETPSYNFAVTE
jgi:hypothetical protein